MESGGGLESNHSPSLRQTAPNVPEGSDDKKQQPSLTNEAPANQRPNHIERPNSITPDLGNAEPPSKRQRQDGEVWQPGEQGPAARVPGAQPPATFPGDSLFRCQRVIELLLRHPYIGHFNQALGQPNITTIHHWLRDLSNAPDDVKSPADLFALLRRVFVSFDRACPADHPLKRVGQALEQHFQACWQQAGLDSFAAERTPSSGQMPPGNPAPARPNSAGPQSQQAQTQGSGGAVAAGLGGSGHGPGPNQDAWTGRVHQPLPQQPSHPQMERSNSPVIALPEKANTAQQPVRTQPSAMTSMGQQMPARNPLAGGQRPNHTQHSLPGNLPAHRGLVDLESRQASLSRLHMGPGAVTSQGGLGNQGRQHSWAGPLGDSQKAAELQRLMAEAEVKPHERMILEQAMELRRRKAIAEQAIQQAQVAFQRYKLCEQELNRIKAQLAQEKAKVGISTGGYGVTVPNSSNGPPLNPPADATCTLSTWTQQPGLTQDQMQQLFQKVQAGNIQAAE